MAAVPGVLLDEVHDDLPHLEIAVVVLSEVVHGVARLERPGVRHLELPKMWGKDEHRDADFDGAVGDDAVVAEAWAAWRAEVAYAEEFQSTHAMDVLGQHDDGDLEMREVVVHLIEEYARHCGHADLLRECIDGRTGD